MKFLSALFLCLFSSGIAFAQLTPFEKGDGNYSARYNEVVAYYKQLIQDHTYAQFDPSGEYLTDCGVLFQPVILGNPNNWRKQPKVLINNGVHPGESCGVDASMMFARDLLSDSSRKKLLDQVTIIINPMYNIGGSMNSSCCTRANQDGPSIQGFRGNSRNLDLNRDYIKQDSKNAASLTEIFLKYFPEFFVDTHTSNGADYPYTMTLLQTQKDKLHPIISEFMMKEFEPALYDEMAEEGWEMIPYVNTRSNTPDDGLIGFLESPRFATGFTGLYQTIGYTTEAHMLKPYSDRVWSTYQFLMVMTEQAAKHGTYVRQLRSDAFEAIAEEGKYAINWTLDTTQYDEINFKGYEAEYSISEVTGKKHYTYNREKKWEKKIPFYNTFQKEEATLPKTGWLIPTAYAEATSKLLSVLEWNGKIEKWTGETQKELSYYRITNTETRVPAYEGHHLHYNTEVTAKTAMVNLVGDYYFIPVKGNETHLAFLLQVLNPQAIDSYFNWNFFDEILQQKEYFSPYVFEGTAKKLLAENKQLNTEFQAYKSSNRFASHYQLLDWIYKRSDYYEKSHMRVPIYWY